MKFSHLSVLAFASSALSQVMLHPNGNTAKCLEVRGAVYALGTPVQIFDCNGTPAQQWTLSLGATAVRVANPPTGTSFCLDAGATPTNGTQLKIWECFDNLPAQEWFLTSDNRIALLNQGLCLDLPNGDLTNTNVVQTWMCTDGDVNQIWTS